MITYTLESTEYPGEWERRFEFTADSDEEARILANGWARFLGISEREVRVDRATDEVLACPWMHNEWVR